MKWINEDDRRIFFVEFDTDQKLKEIVSIGLEWAKAFNVVELGSKKIIIKCFVKPEYVDKFVNTTGKILDFEVSKLSDKENILYEVDGLLVY